MRWEHGKIGDFCEVTSSKRIFYSEYVETGIPFYRSKEIIEKNKGNPVSEPLYISKEKYELIQKKFGVPVQGDMLLTSVGTIGVPYVVQAEDCFYFKDGNLTWFRKFSNNLSVSFLYYWISSAVGQGVLYNATIGSSQKALTISTLKDIEIPIPPIGIQNRIAGILSAYDNLIENNQKQIKLLEEAAQRLYKEWFVDLHFPGYEQTTIVDGVPEGWRKGTLSEVMDINKRSIPKDYRHDYIDYIDIGSVSRGRIANSTVYATNTAPGRAKRVACDGDIIWGMVRPNLMAYALVTNPTDTTIFSTGFAILSATKVPFSYLYCLVTQDQFVKYLVNCTNGAAYPAVKPVHFENAEILIPRSSVSKDFHSITEPMFRKIEICENQIKRLQEARDRLLPKLMSGEVEV